MARSCSTGSSGLLHALAQHHGAGAAVAFAAAFLGAGAVQVFAQHFQQRAVGRDVVQGDRLAPAQELDGAGGHFLVVLVGIGRMEKQGTPVPGRLHMSERMCGIQAYR
jgi:hypothetical protein